MRTIVLVFSLIVLAAPSYAASLEQKCREMVGNEEPEAEGEATLAASKCSASATA